jgi:transglutaminase-like putative cysteine protease
MTIKVTANPVTSLEPTACVDCGTSNVKERAAKLTARHRKERDKVRSIFDFVRDEIRYNFAPDVSRPKHFTASHTLEIGNGFCMQKAALFAALCRASGVPARLSYQSIIDYMIKGQFLELMGKNSLRHHGMNAVHLDGRWILVDCTLDRTLVDRKQYRLVEFDGTRDALLPATDRAGNPHFKITRQFGLYRDTTQFAMRAMLRWTKRMPYAEWRKLVHGKDGSM